jgi:hypothetical protein
MVLRPRSDDAAPGSARSRDAGGTGAPVPPIRGIAAIRTRTECGGTVPMFRPRCFGRADESARRWILGCERRVSMVSLRADRLETPVAIEDRGLAPSARRGRRGEVALPSDRSARGTGRSPSGSARAVSRGGPGGRRARRSATAANDEPARAWPRVRRAAPRIARPLQISFTPRAGGRKMRLGPAARRVPRRKGLQTTPRRVRWMGSEGGRPGGAPPRPAVRQGGRGVR